MASSVSLSQGKFLKDDGTSPSQSAYTLTYSTAAATVPTATAAAVVTTGVTNSSPYGFVGATQGDALSVAVNANGADILALKKVVVQLILDLRAAGLAT